jgi:hypothetical protein
MDSLIACIAVGPIISRRIALPFVILFGVGVGDGGGYLLGTAFHWSVSDSFSTFIPTPVLTVLGPHILPHHKVGHCVAPPAVSTSEP